MSPVENERFIEIISSRLKHPIDEVWGPVAPNVRAQAPHLRELQLAYSVASLADSLELAQEGLGKSLLTRFADDPEDFCPLWPLPHFHWPPKKGEPEPPEPIDPEVLGASLVLIAPRLRNGDLRALVVARGEEMIG